MLSIIIPVWNLHEMTKECISAIIENTSEPFEIILIDNGSTPPYPLEAVHGHGVVIRNEINTGFPCAVNLGIRKSSGEIICLLNDDVVCTPGWAEMLIKGLDQFDIVGPQTNSCSGVQCTQVSIYYDRDGLDQRAAEYRIGREGMTLEVNFIIGFLMMFRRSLYDEIGIFDESIWPSSGEEIDFAFRAREKGKKIGFLKDVYVHHEGSKTFEKMNAKEPYIDIIRRSNAHLAEKWGEDFWDRQLLPLTDGTGLRLNVGCGNFKKKGFINIDKSDLVKPDILCDVFDMPFDPGTVDEIYAGHIYEHFDYIDGIKALHYWHSLLKPGGIISISVPDILFLMRDYVKDPTADNLRNLNDTYIYSEGQESPHKYAYDEGLLRQVMTEAGFIELKRMPIDHPYYPYAVDWQTGLTGRKEAAHADN